MPSKVALQAVLKLHISPEALGLWHKLRGAKAGLREYVLQESSRQWSVGSGKGCDLRLLARGVKRRHGVVFKKRTGEFGFKNTKGEERFLESKDTLELAKGVKLVFELQLPQFFKLNQEAKERALRMAAQKDIKRAAKNPARPSGNALRFITVGLLLFVVLGGWLVLEGGKTPATPAQGLKPQAPLLPQGVGADSAPPASTPALPNSAPASKPNIPEPLIADTTPALADNIADELADEPADGGSPEPSLALDEVLSKCRAESAAFKSLSELRSCLAPVRLNDPENTEARAMEQDLVRRLKAQKKRLKQKADQQAFLARAARAWGRVQAVDAAGDLVNAIGAYELFIKKYSSLKNGAAQKRDNKAKKRLAELKKERRARVEKAKSECERLGREDRFREALGFCKKARALNPDSVPGLMESLRKRACTRVKKWFSEAKFHEYGGTLDARDELLQKIVNLGVECPQTSKARRLLSK